MRKKDTIEEGNIGILFVPNKEKVPSRGEFISLYSGVVMYDPMRDGKITSKRLTFVKTQVKIEKMEKTP